MPNGLPHVVLAGRTPACAWRHFVDSGGFNKDAHRIVNGPGDGSEYLRDRQPLIVRLEIRLHFPAQECGGADQQFIGTADLLWLYDFDLTALRSPHRLGSFFRQVTERGGVAVVARSILFFDFLIAHGLHRPLECCPLMVVMHNRQGRRFFSARARWYRLDASACKAQRFGVHPGSTRGARHRKQRPAAVSLCRRSLALLRNGARASASPLSFAIVALALASVPSRVRIRCRSRWAHASFLTHPAHRFFFVGCTPSSSPRLTLSPLTGARPRAAAPTAPPHSECISARS